MTRPGRTRTARLGRLGFWVLFTVVFGLLPLLANGIRDAMHDDFSWRDLLSTGELFIVAAVLAAGSVGEILDSNIPKSLKPWATFAGWCCVATLIFNTVAYTSIDQTHPSAVGPASLMFFAPTVIASGSAIYIAAAGR